MKVGRPTGKSVSEHAQILGKKLHLKKEIALIHSEMAELKEELRYKQHLLRVINKDLLITNGKRKRRVGGEKPRLKLVYSCDKSQN